MAPKLHLPPAAIRRSWEEHITGTSRGISPTIWGGSINGEIPNSWLVYFTENPMENPRKMDDIGYIG